MNTELLLKIRDKILAEPENFLMLAWHCNTAHCIAGWAIVLTETQCESWQTGDMATVELKLRLESAKRLFHEEYWPEQFRKPCTVAGQRAKQAAARILHFLETEGRE